VKTPLQPGSDRLPSSLEPVLEPADFLWIARRQEAIDVGESQAEPLPSEILALLRAHAERLSVFYSGLDPLGQLVSAANYPGYLMLRCESWQVFVPWPLAPSFPGQETVVDLIEIANKVALPPVTNVCISGSSAALGSDVAVGDLDFCQYVSLSPASIVDSAFAFTTPEEARVLIAASYGRSCCVTAPWEQTWPTLRTSMADQTIPSADRFMLEFLGHSGRFGLLPVSTVVLASDFKNHASGAAARSFVYQEAVAIPCDAETPEPPWTLVAPEDLGRYIGFLRKEIVNYAEVKPIKAVKRVLSLARTIGQHEFGDEALELLQSVTASAVIQQQRLSEIEAQYSRAGEPEQKLLATI
jgi:hypothetical protein